MKKEYFTRWRVGPHFSWNQSRVMTLEDIIARIMAHRFIGNEFRVFKMKDGDVIPMIVYGNSLFEELSHA